jgi:hypothetical protein
MTARLARLFTVALASCALATAAARAQNTVPGSSGNAPPRTTGTSSARNATTKSLDSVEGSTRSLDAAETTKADTRSLDGADTGSTTDPDAVPEASEAPPGDADTAPLRMGNPDHPYANPAPKPATPPVPAAKPAPAPSAEPAQWADWERRLEDGVQRLGAARARADQAEAAVTSMITRNYPAGAAKARLLKEREDARADLSRALQEYPELLDEARRDGVPDSVLAPYEAKAPQS